MECGFVLEAPGAESKWISLAEFCKELATEFPSHAEHYEDLAKKSGDIEIKAKIVDRRTKNEWQRYDIQAKQKSPDDDDELQYVNFAEFVQDGDAAVLRAAHADIQGSNVDKCGREVGDEALYQAIELTPLFHVIAKLVARYNMLEPAQRAGFFTRERGGAWSVPTATSS